MKTLSEMLHGCMLLVSSKPTKQQLLKMDSRLISQIERPSWDCGVHVRYLVTAFESVSPDWTARDVLQRLVLPQTSAWRCRYVDTIDASFIGRATYFVSYNVLAPFHQMVDAIKRRFYDVNGQELPDAADAYLWIDTFAVNHHIVGNKIEYIQVQEVLHHCYACLVLLDGKCRVLSRLLPLFEIWATLHVASKSVHGVRLEVLPACTDPRYLRNEWLHLNVRNGSALRDFDKDWVLDQLMSRGVQRVNHMIREGLANAARRLVTSLCERVDLCEHLFLLEEEEGQEEMVRDFDAAGLAHDLHVCATIIQLHGHYTEAVSVYKQAVRVWQLARTRLAHENPLTLLMHYTELLLLLKRWDEARIMAEEAYDLSVQVAQAEHERGRANTSLSGAHFSTEVYAVDRGGNAAAARVPEPVGLGTPPWMHCQILLARAYVGLGDPQRAEILVREVYSAQAERVSRLPPRLSQKLRRDQVLHRIRLDSRADKAKALIALADILRLSPKENTALEAIKLYLRAQKGLGKALGKSHPDVAYVQLRIGQLLRSQKKLDQACQVLTDVLQCYASSWGEHHPETASAMVYLADVELAMLGIRDYEFTDADRQSALQRATRQYMQAFDIRKVCLGINHPDTLATLGAAIVQLLNSSTSRLQLSKVEPMCSLAAKCSMSMHAQQVTEQISLVPTDVGRKLGGNVVSCLMFMGVMLATSAKPKEAALMFEEAERKAVAELPSNHQFAAQCMLCRADLLHVQHDWTSSEELYRKALAVYTTLLGPAEQTAAAAPEQEQTTFTTNPMRSLARMSGVVINTLARRTSIPSVARPLDTTMSTTYDATVSRQGPDASGSSITRTDFNHKLLLATGSNRPRRLSLSSNPGRPSDNGVARSGVSMSGALQQAQRMAATSSRLAGKSFVQAGAPKIAGVGAAGLAFAGLRSASMRYPSGLESARASVDDSTRLSWTLDPGGPIGESGPTPPWITIPVDEVTYTGPSFIHTPATHQTLGRVSSPRITPTTSKVGSSLHASALHRASAKAYATANTGQQSQPSTPTANFLTASKLFNSRSMRQKATTPVLLTEMLAPQGSVPVGQLNEATRNQYTTQNTAGLDTLFSTMGMTQDNREMDNPLFTVGFAEMAAANQSIGRQSAFSKFARRAGARLVSTLSAVSPSPKDVYSPTQMTQQGLVERVVQPPKLGETQVNPHQLVLLRRGKLAEDMVTLLKYEAAVVANNLALLLRWNENVAQSEQQLRFALSLFLPSKVLGLLQAAPPANNPQQNSHTTDTLNLTNLDLRPYMTNTMTYTQNLNTVGTSFSATHAAAAPLMDTPKNTPGQDVLGPNIGSSVWRAKLHTQLTGQDPQVVHVGALMISNLASFLASQSRSAEAVELYWHALVYCTHISRGTDAMIIALNLLQLLSNRMWPGDLEVCKAVLKRYVGPVLGAQIGLDNGNQGGCRHVSAVMQAAMQEAGLQPTSTEPGSKPSLTYVQDSGPAKMHQQILEALAARIVDDGGQVLYQWAANTMARLNKQPGYTKSPKLPQTVFMLQVPGVHLECVHMVRWLAVVDPNLGSITNKPIVTELHTHIGSGASSARRG